MTAPLKDRPAKLTMSEALDKSAAECVEEILAATGVEGGESWFAIIRRKMKKVATMNTEKEQR
jgi:hypothetical protein